jgi:GNAT superfamily N-acetyltransferase
VVSPERRPAHRARVVPGAPLATRARAAIAYFDREHRPWFLAGSQQWLGEGALDTLARLGLTQALTVVGMVADEFAPPVRPLPEMDTRRIDDTPGRLALADLNAAVYHVAAEWVRGAVAGEVLWHTPLYGYVAYADGTPVSTALAIPLHGVLYVGFVATALAYRRRGLAELVMRRSLEAARQATGLTGTALHATADGYPVYLRMGYRPVKTFALFVPR